MSVNYIKHLQAFVARTEQDERLTPWHISLYYALFHCWNNNQRVNPVSINRQEVMSLSKIGSVNTYTKALRQLHDWEYLLYEPSNNRWVGSKIYMYRFDKGTDNSTDNGSDNTTVSEVIKQVRPSLKSIKNKKNIKDKKGEKVAAQLTPNSEKEVQKGTEQNLNRSTIPPSINEVNDFFLSSGSSADEAENFHNYFESNGWLVGGKAKMKDWKAAARNWINRSASFNDTKTKRNSPSKAEVSSGHLNVNQNKDYSIPL